MKIAPVCRIDLSTKLFTREFGCQEKSAMRCTNYPVISDPNTTIQLVLHPVAFSDSEHAEACGGRVDVMLSAKPGIPNLVHRLPYAADRSRPRSLLSPVGDTPPPASGECLVGLSMTRSCAQGASDGTCPCAQQGAPSAAIILSAGGKGVTPRGAKSDQLPACADPTPYSRLLGSCARRFARHSACSATCLMRPEKMAR
jgi:hypothetical protein